MRHPEHRMGSGAASRAGRATVLGTALLAAALTAGCEVVNPGPVGDEFIALPASQAGLILGSWERMNRVVGWNALDEALPAREIFPGGQTGNYGHATARQAGNMGGWGDSGSYNSAQQARWIAEEAIRRFTDRGDVSPDRMAQAYLAAGYANRVNGDNYCWGVVDSGPLFEGWHYWERAETHFTTALGLAVDSEQTFAAYAGRAQARLALEDWAGALADARQVPTDFVLWLDMDYGQGGSRANSNHVMFAQADNPYRGWTVTHTWFHGYYTETGDPRTPWREFPNPTSRVCVGALLGYGTSVPCTQQQKYKTQDDDIRIASGAEMRLLEAEAMLRMNPGNWQAAMATVNANRVRYPSDHDQTPLEPWVANSLDEAWTYLMRERAVEFWLEGRRWTDMRRWEPYLLEYGTFDEDGQTVLELPRNTPGELDWPCFECVMQNPEVNMFTTNSRGRPAINGQSRPRELCYNISNTERNNNPNIFEEEEEIGGI